MKTRLLTLAWLIAANVAALVSVSPALAASPQTAQYVCLIVLDAGRPDYITKNLPTMPNLRALMPKMHRYDRAWVGDLMSITPPSHAVIGTGSLPKNDGGIVNWDWGIHSTGKVSPSLQAVENYQNNYVFKLMKASGTPTLAAMIRKKHPRDLVIAGSGAHFHAAGPMGGPDANWIFSYQRDGHGHWAPFTLGSNKVPAALLSDPSLRTPLPAANGSTVPLLYDPVKLGVQDTMVMQFAARAVQRYRPRGVMINLPEVDTIGHWSHRWYHDEAILYRAFDRNLGSLIGEYKRAGIYSKTLFVITSDHGMIQSPHRVVNRLAVKAILADQHATPLLINGGGAAGPTMTSIWLKNPAQNGTVAQAIFRRHLDNVSAVFYMDTSGGGAHYRLAGCESCAPELVKAYTYLMKTQEGSTGEDIGILLRENARNSGLPQMMGRHGGADWGSQNITLMMMGPGVKPGLSHDPARLADIAPTVERLMGITPHARDGVVLADAVKSPAKRDVTVQRRLNAVQAPYVAAVMARAKHDIYLAAHGQLPNFVPADEQVIHWKRRLAVTILGIVVMLATLAGLAWAIRHLRSEGTGLAWA